MTIDEWATNGPAVIPHAAAANGQGVGAVPYYTQQTPETSSSPGPTSILFSKIGVRLPSAEVRQSPQVAGVSGVDNTFLGSNLSFKNCAAADKPNFFGTSAAASHVAAVAALVRQANPSFTPAEVYARLQSTADDVAAAGFDSVSGFGLVNAFDAVHPTIAPCRPASPTASRPASSRPRTRGALTGPGRIQVTAANGPLAGAKHLTLDSTLTGSAAAGLNEVTLHVDLPAPARRSCRSSSVNTPTMTTPCRRRSSVRPTRTASP